MVQVGSQKYRRMSRFFSFSYLSCGQIWLNLSKDDCHFGYITKVTGKILYISLCGKCFFSYCMIIQSPANKHVRILTQFTAPASTDKKSQLIQLRVRHVTASCYTFLLQELAGLFAPPPFSYLSRHACPLSCSSLPQCTRHSPKQPLWPKK